MDLTAWQRICNRLLGGVFKKRARGDKELSDNLVKASMPMMPEVYLATVFVTTFVITALGIGFVALFFVPEIGVIDLWKVNKILLLKHRVSNGNTGILI